jgi:hypothetical protein
MVKKSMMKKSSGNKSSGNKSSGFVRDPLNPQRRKVRVIAVKKSFAKKVFWGAFGLGLVFWCFLFTITPEIATSLVIGLVVMVLFLRVFSARNHR